MYLACTWYNVYCFIFIVIFLEDVAIPYFTFKWFTKYQYTFRPLYIPFADPSGRAVQGVSLRSLACWDCGFESRWRHWCLSLTSGVCCQVGFLATSLSLVGRNSTECGVPECDREASIMRKPWPTRGCYTVEKACLFAVYASAFAYVTRTFCLVISDFVPLKPQKNDWRIEGYISYALSTPMAI
jgi:hypothetical protein